MLWNTENTPFLCRSMFTRIDCTNWIEDQFTRFSTDCFCVLRKIDSAADTTRKSNTDATVADYWNSVDCYGSV